MENTQKAKRQIAKKTDIKSIVLGKYIKEDGWEPNYIITDDNRKLSRVNVMGTVVAIQEDGPSKSITLDDSSASILSRTFENITMFNNIAVGDTILIIGRPRDFNGEKYIIAEIIQKINSQWIKVRQKELSMLPKDNAIEKQETKEEIIVEDVLITDKFDEALKLIKELDSGQGVDTDTLIEKGYPEETLDKLLKNGEIFEISPGKLKILE